MHLTKLAREYGDKPALIMGESGESLSYAELERQSNKIAHLFRSRGLRPGDHIAVLMENRPEFFPVVWAAQRSGLFYTPVNWHLSAAEAAYVVADCGARRLARAGTDRVLRGQRGQRVLRDRQPDVAQPPGLGRQADRRRGAHLLR
jgi:long-chain acyl-CoA synthetase